jgi:hypothetical protein
MALTAAAARADVAFLQQAADQRANDGKARDKAREGVERLLGKCW